MSDTVETQAKVIIALREQVKCGSVNMDDRDSLLSIAQKLRWFAGLAYGDPERVPVTAANLRDLADRIERVAIGETRPDESERA